MFGKEGAGEIHQISYGSVIDGRPKIGELEAVAALFTAGDRVWLLIIQVFLAGGVGIVLGVRAVGDDKELHVVKQPRTAPETFAVIAIDLVENASRRATPRRLSSTCTIGKPLTKMVTS